MPRPDDRLILSPARAWPGPTVRMRAWLPIPVFLVLAIAVGAIFRYPLVLDDPFITYRYASNLIAGNGFVYNAGEHVLSTTTPLYALLLATFGLVFRDIPTLGFWLSVFGLGTCACFVYLIASHFDIPMAGLAAALITPFAPGLVLTFGLETGLYLALAFGALYFYFRHRLMIAFALLALLTLTRNDGILLALLLAAHMVLADRKPGRLSFKDLIYSFRFHAKPLVVFALILLPWLVFAWWWFGSPLPFTLTAKVAQAESGLWDNFSTGFVKWFGDWISANWPLAVFGGVGLINSIRARSAIQVAAIWALLHVFAYSIVGAAFYPWYVAPLLPVASLFAGIGTLSVALWLSSRLKRPSAFVFASVIIVALILIPEVRSDLASGMTAPSPKSEVYRQAADWIAGYTPRDANVDALEVGLIGYYDERQTLDFVGLVDPGRVPYLRARAFAEGVRYASADYVIAIPPDTWLPQDAWFANTYRPVQEFRAPGFYSGKPLVIYRRVDAGQVPSEQIALGLSLDHQFELLRIDMFARDVARGEALPVRLHLRDDKPIDTNIKLTLQLVGPENRIVGQLDTPYPARLPESDQPFIDHQGLPVRNNALPGSYDLIMAAYDATTGDRLTAFDAGGNDKGDFISLGEIQVR